ncbi:MAG TPA: TolC family protein [Syntrophorhabdaceae bacterium]|nr:TolC family protein [Syntrophorhabdaceae bacterium]HPP05795.1 TolC family protein [Syntrophorhabdaceae bacterium]
MKKIILFSVFCLFFANIVFSITLEEAIKRGLEVSYALKQQKETVKSFEYQYISSIDPYLPKANIESGYTRYLYGNPSQSRTSGTGNIGNDLYSTTGSLSFRIFDGGLRSAKRKAAANAFEREKEQMESIKIDVVYNIKTTFFTALGKKMIVEKKKEAYETTKKIFDLTKAKYDVGVAKKSDVLQAEVRLTSARIELFESEKEFEKALEDLNSLLLFRPDENLVIEGNLFTPDLKETPDTLIDRALKARPDVTYQLKEIERLNMVYNEKKSEWYPKIDVELQQSRADKSFLPNNRQDTLGLTLSYPIFDGVGRHYNLKAAASELSAAKFRLEEIKRTVKLEIAKAYKDFEKGLENTRLYGELLKEAQTNFDQAYGEYKVGKGDILTLLQSEKDLAKAKENLVVSLYQLNNAMAYLEKVAYITGY